MTARYSIVENAGNRVVTAYVNGVMLTTDAATNPNFDEIADRLFEADTNPHLLDGIEELFTPEVEVQRKFKRVSERVSVREGKVFFDGDPIDDILSDHLLRLIRSGRNNDVTCLVNFWEKIAQNPSEHSRESLLRWLLAEDFSITTDGDILGYKGLREDGTSIHAGPAIVDGVQMNGHIPNVEGSVIELARSTVVQDSFAACAYGLHVGTDEYARNFGYGVTVEVLVNPRDVVSVPVDCNGQKMRVCRYRVGKVSEAKRSEAVVADYSEVDNDFVADEYDSLVGSEWDDVSF